MIKLTSNGSVFFAQQRIGRDQITFTCYKLRTMETGTTEVGTHEVASSSVTPVGRFLRATKVDELPQLWNVLAGDMSVVGPRPCLPVQTELIEERLRRGVYKLVPGITGVAQIEGIDMSDPKRLAEKDAEYIDNQSFFGDLYLILQTVTGKGSGDKVKKTGE